MKRFQKSKFYEIIIFMVILLSVFILRAFLAVRYGVAIMYGDEVLHWGLSKSIFHNGETVIRGIPVYYYNNIYSLCLSIVHIIKNYSLCLIVAKIINALIMVSGLIPLYLLGQKMLESKRKAIWIIMLISLLPEFVYTTKLIQENLQFTIMMWFWYVIYNILDHEMIKNKDAVILGAMSCLCYIGKEVGLGVFVGICIFYVILGIYYKNIKEYLLKLGIHISTFFILFSTYIFIYKMININTKALERFGNIPLVNLIKPIYYIKLIYPGFIYLLTCIIAAGIFAIIIPLMNYKNLPIATRKFIILISAITVVTIGMVLILITSVENYDQSSIRVHLRYIFYFIPPFLIILAQSLKIDINKYDLKLGVLIGGILIILISNINIFAVMGSNIDGDSNRYLTENEMNSIMNITNYKALVISFICIFIIWGLWCIYIKNKKLLSISIFLVYILFSVVNNVLCYNEENRTKTYIAPYEKQYVSINKFIHSNKSTKDKVVILANDNYSESSLELALEDPYYYITKDALKSIMQNSGMLPLSKIKYEGFENYDAYLDISRPEYIIKRKDNWEFCNYSKVFETDNYEVLKASGNNKSFIIKSMMDQIAENGWVQNTPITITICNQKSEQNSISIKCFSIKDNLPVKISDNYGNEKVYYVNTETGNINFSVNGSSSEPTKITITPLSSYKPCDIYPNNTDSSNLSINIQNISIK